MKTCTTILTIILIAACTTFSIDTDIAAMKRSSETYLDDEKPTKQQKLSDEDIQSYFSPNDNISQKIIDLINNAKKTIHIAIYTLTDWSIKTALLGAKKRGVDIEIIVNQTPEQTDSHPLIKTLIDNDIIVHIFQQRNTLIMHNKFAIFDDNIIVTGSYNWTYNAKQSYENVIIIHNAKACPRFITQFKEIKTHIHLDNLYHHGTSSYFKPNGASTDYQTALADFVTIIGTEHAQEIHPEAFFAAHSFVGEMYYRGQAVDKNYLQALDHFHIVTDADDDAKFINPGAYIQTHNILGEMNYCGQGMPRNYQQAYKHFNAVIDTDDAQYIDPEAFINVNNRLGEMYYYGRGVAQNQQLASEYFSISLGLFDEEQIFSFE
jgi:hypothetical protein